MQTLATLPHTACGHRSSVDTLTTLKPILSRVPTRPSQHRQRRALRAEAAGSLVLSTLAAGVAAYYLSRQVTAAEQVRVVSMCGYLLAFSQSPPFLSFCRGILEPLRTTTQALNNHCL